jgi:serine/threonine-protein kinase RsbW
MKNRAFPTELKSVHDIQDFVRENLPESHRDPAKIMNIELIIEEIVLNIVNYAFPEKPAESSESSKSDKSVKKDGVIDVEVGTDGQALVLIIRDNGIAFNLLETSDPDINAEIDDREIGGLGIFFVKQLSDDVKYSRKNGKNIISLVL